MAIKLQEYNELPQSSKNSIQKLISNRKRILSLVSIFAFLFLLLTLRPHPSYFLKAVDGNGSLCPKIEPMSPSYVNNSIEKILYDPEFKEKSIKKFSGALKIPTVVQDINPPPSEDLEFWSAFFDFHQYLEKTFPLIYATLKVEKVNEVGLLYTWEGTNPSLKPMMLTAHQDVVPVNPDTWNDWSYGPFSGTYDPITNTLWGRGSLDCKNLLIAELEAVEELISNGYIPERTVLLAFGFDEESSGVLGASHIGPFVLERYGKDGIYSIVDEGFGVAKINDNLYVATPITAEKGYVDVEIQVKGHGGHSSIPPKHTNVGVAANFVSLLEYHPFKPQYTPSNPVWSFLYCLAEHDENLTPAAKKTILASKESKKEQKKLLSYLSDIFEFKELIRTSQAVDIFNGGIKSNALPEGATVVVNHRIETGSNVKDTIDHDLDIATTVARKFGYGLVFQGETLIPETPLGFIEVTTTNKSLEPAPRSPKEGSPVWEVFSRTIQDVFGTWVFRDGDIDFYVSESQASFNTDTRYYWDLTKNIYRFFGSVITADQFSLFHSVNEHIEYSAHLSAVGFIYEYILNVNEHASGES
ncbi:related to Carboxypeptidase S [Saccharomycodes ludwigii]|uniref:Related to Carboxypeptidase S n=1 Tax=Saccharomycodes ludwigii TaxID=36035 RepID=A0A376BAZ6_9ASCO|nr:hypothetical protein SCDLUD_003956 [Saccharomycodes ludwigii]KAH3899673.1 hypothetical protein SCDLUD_003956 [Saccharomycodes ludwigii]SSD61734.1 related to Carboxypeptidase S [Saccharomycodes ludwigii]